MEIQQEFQQCGIRVGSKEMIGGYQKTVGRLMKKVTEDEMKEAEQVAQEWNEVQPPPEVQAMYVHISNLLYDTPHRSSVQLKKGWKYTCEYAETMWKQCGTRVVVMVAWKDQNGKVMAGM